MELESTRRDTQVRPGHKNKLDNNGKSTTEIKKGEASYVVISGAAGPASAS